MDNPVKKFLVLQLLMCLFYSDLKKKLLRMALLGNVSAAGEAKAEQEVYSIDRVGSSKEGHEPNAALHLTLHLALHLECSATV